MDDALASILDYGLLGASNVLLILALIHMYRAKERQAKEHREEIQRLVDRHVAKAERWVEKGNELGEKFTRVLEASVRRRGSDE